MSTPNRGLRVPLFILGGCVVSKLLAPSFIFGIVEAGYGYGLLNWSFHRLILDHCINLCILHDLPHPPNRVRLPYGISLAIS